MVMMWAAFRTGRSNQKSFSMIRRQSLRLSKSLQSKMVNTVPLATPQEDGKVNVTRDVHGLSAVTPGVEHDSYSTQDAITEARGNSDGDVEFVFEPRTHVLENRFQAVICRSWAALVMRDFWECHDLTLDRNVQY